jgi:hypothetical protein
MTNLDFVHDIKAVLEAVVRESNPDQCVDQSVCVARGPGKGIAEVGARIGNRCVASKDDKTSDANAIWGKQKLFQQRRQECLQDKCADFDESNDVRE